MLVTISQQFYDGDKATAEYEQDILTSNQRKRKEKGCVHLLNKAILHAKCQRVASGRQTKMLKYNEIELKIFGDVAFHFSFQPILGTKSCFLKRDLIVLTHNAVHIHTN